jgi:FlaA1/EpsC-like NDP-sugar epimerase
VLIIYAVVVVLMVTGSRASFRVISDALQRRRHNGRRIVVYGAGDGGAMAVRELLSNPDHDVRMVGFIDDDPQEAARTRSRLSRARVVRHAVAARALEQPRRDRPQHRAAIDAIRLRQLERSVPSTPSRLVALVVGLEPVVDTERGGRGNPSPPRSSKIRKFPRTER